MTINTTSISTGPYTGTGSTDTYLYDFKVQLASEIIVTETDLAGVSTTLVEGTDFSVTGVGTSGGGNVVRTAGNLPTGFLWLIRRRTDKTQQADFPGQGAFTPLSHENAFDKAMMITQENAADLLLAMRAPVSDLSPNMILPIAIDRAGEFPVFDASGHVSTSQGSGGGDTSLRTDLASIAAAKGFNLVAITKTPAEDSAGATIVNARLYPGDLERYGADPLGVVDSTTEIATALLVGSQTNGPKIFGQGAFLCSAKLVIKSDCDFSNATFNFTGIGAGIALEVSTGSAADPTDLLRNKRILLPKVNNNDKPGSGWAGQGTGVRLVNVLESEVYIKNVTGFKVGVLGAAYGSGTAAGLSYNDIHIGRLFNNESNLKLQPGNALGFTNENNFYGGRLSYDAAEGTRIAGTRQIHLLEFTAGLGGPNNNNFFGVLLEGIQEQYAVLCEETANDNQFWGCRWEASDALKVARFVNSLNNIIHYGINAASLNIEETGTAQHNHVYTRNGPFLQGANSSAGAYNSRNSSSSALPVFAGFEAAGDIRTDDWVGAITGQGLAAKAPGDLPANMFFQARNKSLYLGNGTAPPIQVLIGNPLQVTWQIPVGLRVYTDATRPSAATLGTGTQIWNSDDNAPNYVEGSNWRDAAGVVT